MASMGYRQLFGVSVLHGFYAGGLCSALHWQPTVQTRRLLARAGCIIGPSRDGLAVFFDESRRDLLASCLGDTREPMRLAWRLQPSGLPLESISAGMPLEAGRVLFLSDAGAVQEADGRWRLHAGDTVDAACALPLDAPEVAGHLERSDHVLRPRPLVQVTLGAQDLPAANGQAVPRQFLIRFAARATLWKYVLPAEWPAQDLQVVDAAGQASFGAPSLQTLADGRAAITARSLQAIALQERPAQQFQLRRRDRGEDIVVIERLPAAAAGPLASETVDGQSVPVSEIYV